MQGSLLMGPQGQWVTGALKRTKMMCPEIAWEDAFVQALADADSYQWKDTTLVLLQHGVPLAVFSRNTPATAISAPPDSHNPGQALLFAHQFRVQYIIDEQGMADMRNTEATMHFDTANQRVTGRGSCNRFFAEARFTFIMGNSGRLVMGKAGSTLMACPQYMDLEQRFFRLLEQADGFSITGKTLRITRMGSTMIELLAS
jgi:heat shock protein HslJ